LKFKINLILLGLVLFACREKIIAPITNSTLPPPPPRDVAVLSAYDGVILLQWQALNEIGVNKYFIYRGVNSPSHLNLWDSTTLNYYTDDSLYYDSTYYYSIVSVNRAGIKSKFSKIVSAKPVNMYAPYPPFGLKINATNWNDTLLINLYWNAPFVADVDHYEIYRDTSKSFVVNSATFIGSTSKTFYVDSKNLRLLTDYYYKIVSVDKGGLKSKPTGFVRDVILDRPIIISPTNNSIVKQIFNFKFITSSRDASYNIIIQSNKLFGFVDKIKLGIQKAKDTVSVNYDAYYLEKNKIYYWRVVSYSGFSSQANSFSRLGTFKISNL